MAPRTKTAPIDPMSALPLADMAAQMREQWLTSLKQGHELALGAVKTIVDLAKSVPMPDMPAAIPTPAFGDAVTFAFDLATDTLVAQRNFAVQLADLFTPVLAS